MGVCKMNFEVFNKVYGENLPAEEVVANIEALEDEEVIKLATHEFIILWSFTSGILISYLSGIVVDFAEYIYDL